MTTAQRQALERLWGRYGVDPGERVRPAELFGREAPVELEIGIGRGDLLLQLATTHPERDFLGVEVHRPGIGRVLNEIERAGLENIRLFKHDAVEVLENQIEPGTIDRVMLFFPDPWPKKRHHKRRIVQPTFIRQVSRLLKPGGLFHLATDWEEYAEWMLHRLEHFPGLRNRATTGGYIERPESRPLTRFERRGTDLGHSIHDLLFEKIEEA